MESSINHKKLLSSIDAQKFFDLIDPQTYQQIMLSLRFRIKACQTNIKEANVSGLIDAERYWREELKQVEEAYNQLP